MSAAKPALMSPADALILENYVLIGNALRVYAKQLDGSAVDARALGGGRTDPTKMAAVALYQIAERLAHALINALAEGAEKDADA